MNKDIIINGIQYQNVSKIKVKDAQTTDLHEFRNTDDANIESKDIPIGKIGYGKDGKIIGTAVNTASDSDINFYDQYGALLASYKLSDLPLSALPEIPALDGPGADQYEFAWTMTLEEVNALTEEADIGVDVTAKEGAKTYIIPNEFGFKMMNSTQTNLYFYGGDENATILIDFGEGKTQTATINANSSTTVKIDKAFIVDGRLDPIAIEKVSGGDFYIGYNTTQTTGFINAPLSYSTKELRIGRGIKGITGCLLTNGCAVEKLIMHNALEYYRASTNNSEIFKNTSRLKTLNIPKSFKRIDNILTYECNRLETIFIHDGVEASRELCSRSYSLRKIVIPKTYVELLSKDIVYQGFALTRLKLPKAINQTDTVKRLVYYCYALKEINVPEGIVHLDESFAYYGYALESLTLPSTLVSIGSNFLYMVSTGIKQIVAKSVVPPILSGSPTAFTSNLKPTLCVPPGAVEAYTTATNWSALAETTVEY